MFGQERGTKTRLCTPVQTQLGGLAVVTLKPQSYRLWKANDIDRGVREKYASYLGGAGIWDTCIGARYWILLAVVILKLMMQLLIDSLFHYVAVTQRLKCNAMLHFPIAICTNRFHMPLSKHYHPRL